MSLIHSEEEVEASCDLQPVDRVPSPSVADYVYQSESELRLQLELAKVELEREKIRRDNHFAAVNRQDRSDAFTNSSFDVLKHLGLVPAFSETDVDTYFRSFERVASSLCWPKKYWPFLLQSALVGKAQRVYVALSDDQCLDYDVVKSEILKAYHLVPEAYRQKFRSARRDGTQTHVEFARIKRDAFEQWLRSSNVSTFDQLCELILLEEFNSCTSKDISVYLQEREVKLLSDAAVAADTFALIHRGSSGKQSFVKRTGRVESHVSVADTGVSSGSPVNDKPQVNTDSFSVKPKVCFYCGRTGHEVSRCWRKARDLAATKPVFLAPVGDKQTVDVGSTTTVIHGGSSVTRESKPVALISSRRVEETESCFAGRPVLLGGKKEVDVVDSDPDLGTFNAFLSQGTVSSEGETRRVTILRDSGSLQTLMLSGTVAGEPTDKCMLVHTLAEILSVPLVKVHLSSKLYCGSALVGLVKQMPIAGVHLLLGNDLVGGRMNPTPQSPVGQVISGEARQPEYDDFGLDPMTSAAAACVAFAEAGEPAKDMSVVTDNLPDGDLCLDALFRENTSTSESNVASSMFADGEVLTQLRDCEPFEFEKSILNDVSSSTCLLDNDLSVLECNSHVICVVSDVPTKVVGGEDLDVTVLECMGAHDAVTEEEQKSSSVIMTDEEVSDSCNLLELNDGVSESGSETESEQLHGVKTRVAGVSDLFSAVTNNFINECDAVRCDSHKCDDCRVEVDCWSCVSVAGVVISPEGVLLKGKGLMLCNDACDFEFGVTSHCVDGMFCCVFTQDAVSVSVDSHLESLGWEAWIMTDLPCPDVIAIFNVFLLGFFCYVRGLIKALISVVACTRHRPYRHVCKFREKVAAVD